MSVLDLAAAKAYLRVTGTNDDTALQAIINAAEAALATHIGPLASTPVTVRMAGRTSSLLLPTFPVISLTSVTPLDGAALTLSDLYLDTSSGVVTFADGATSFTALSYDVAYAAGRASVPADLMLAIKELVRHLWGTQRGPARVTAPTADVPNAGAGTLHLLPYRVSELIAPYLVPRVA